MHAHAVVIWASWANIDARQCIFYDEAYARTAATAVTTPRHPDGTPFTQFEMRHYADELSKTPEFRRRMAE